MNYPEYRKHVEELPDGAKIILTKDQMLELMNAVLAWSINPKVDPNGKPE